MDTPDTRYGHSGPLGEPLPRVKSKVETLGGHGLAVELVEVLLETGSNDLGTGGNYRPKEALEKLANALIQLRSYNDEEIGLFLGQLSAELKAIYKAQTK